MNNKSDKKHKRKQKQKQTKHKKKTVSHKSKTKKEIKGGGGKGWFKGLFSNKSPSSNFMTQSKVQLLQQSLNNRANTASSASPNPQSSVSSQNPQPLTNPVSSNGTYNPTTKLSQLQPPLLPKSNRLANAQHTNSNNSQRNASQAPAPVNSRTLPQNASQAQAPANLINPASSTSRAPANSNNPALIPLSNTQSLPPPYVQPNAQPQGFNTIKSQSRCSIM